MLKFPTIGKLNLFHSLIKIFHFWWIGQNRLHIRRVHVLMSNNTDDSRHPIIWCNHLYFYQFKGSSKSKYFDFFEGKLWWTGLVNSYSSWVRVINRMGLGRVGLGPVKVELGQVRSGTGKLWIGTGQVLTNFIAEKLWWTGFLEVANIFASVLKVTSVIGPLWWSRCVGEVKHADVFKS